jgi:DNA-binding SARP family transcriptional activator/TolB-like protein
MYEGNDSAAPALEINLLGSFRVAVDGVSLDERRWQRRKAKTLLIILALQQGRQIQREQLAEMLSPEQDPSTSLNNFNKLIYAARRALEPDLKRGAASRFILTQGQQVILAPAQAIRVDVDDFERKAAEAIRENEVQIFEEALALYKDDLLVEVLYEDWLVLKREKLRLLRTHLISRLAALYEKQGRFDLSILHLNSLIAADEINEETHRRLMRLYAITDHKSLAIEQYKLCAESLRRVLDVGPEEETEKLYQQIISGELQPRSQASASPPAIEAVPGNQRNIMKTDSRKREGEPPVQMSVNVVEPETDQAGANRRAAQTWPFPYRLYRSLYLITIISALLFIAIGFWIKGRNQEPIDSLIVLPFRDETGDANLEYLADGISETLMRNLSQLPDLRVLARSTAFRYKGKVVDPQRLQKELRVSAVLLGKFLEQNGEPFVTVELFETATGALLWDATYPLSQEKVYHVERQIEESLARRLRPQLSPEELRSLARPDTKNAEAYATYLKGRYFWNQRTDADLRRAIDYFEQTLEIDPLYALAYAGLADTYALGAGSKLSPSAYMPRAKFCVEKALELDEQIAEAHTARAFIAEYYDWDFTLAEREYQRAIELNPNYATAHHWYGEFLSFMGEHGEAIRQIHQAQACDPLSPAINIDVGVIFHVARKHNQAIEQFRKMTAFDPESAEAYKWLMLLYFENGQPEQAKQAYQQAVQLAKTDDPALLNGSFDAHFYALSGNRAMAMQLIEKMKKSEEKKKPTWEIAQVLAILNEKDEAFAWLEITYQNRGGALISLKTNPFFDNLRSDPRFTSFLKRIGLPL